VSLSPRYKESNSLPTMGRTLSLRYQLMGQGRYHRSLFKRCLVLVLCLTSIKPEPPAGTAKMAINRRVLGSSFARLRISLLSAVLSRTP
jgi:hypothetical protein